MYAKKRSYPYLAATDGLMAVRAYQQAHHNSSQIPSVILMDINMPTMDGYEATQQIRAYEKKHDLPGAKIIALTALGSEAAWQEAFGSGCDLFLTKPVKLGDLTRIIEGT
jgi:CheY-like chemotaxis protein